MLSLFANSGLLCFVIIDSLTCPLRSSKTQVSGEILIEYLHYARLAITAGIVFAGQQRHLAINPAN